MVLGGRGRGGATEEIIVFKWRLQRCIVSHYVDEINKGPCSKEKEMKV